MDNDTGRGLKNLKAAICRSIEDMTPFDLYDIYTDIKTIPHVKTEGGFHFDLDQKEHWSEERLMKLSEKINEKKKRITDVMKAEQLRNDILGSSASQTGDVLFANEFMTMDDGRRVPYLPVDKKRKKHEVIIIDPNASLVEQSPPLADR